MLIDFYVTAWLIVMINVFKFRKSHHLYKITPTHMVIALINLGKNTFTSFGCGSRGVIPTLANFPIFATHIDFYLIPEFLINRASLIT